LLIAELEAIPGQFALLAAQHSAGPPRDQSGQLGRIGRGQTVREFEAGVLRLPVGLSPRPLETRCGYHVAHIDAIERGQPLDYAAVHSALPIT